MKTYLLLTVFIFSLHLSVGATRKTIFPDSLKVSQIDSIIKKTKYKKIKSKNADHKHHPDKFWVSRHDPETFIIGVSESNINKTLTMYFFIKGVLVKVSYDCNKPDHTRGGGHYYFSGNILIYKKEIGIEPQHEQDFLANAGSLKLKMARLYQ